MTVGLRGGAPIAGGRRDGGLAKRGGAFDHKHPTTSSDSRQEAFDFPDLRAEIARAKAAGDYSLYCALRRQLLLQQAAAYFQAAPA